MSEPESIEERLSRLERQVKDMRERLQRLEHASASIGQLVGGFRTYDASLNSSYGPLPVHVSEPVSAIMKRIESQCEPMIRQLREGKTGEETDD